MSTSSSNEKPDNKVTTSANPSQSQPYLGRQSSSTLCSIELEKPLEPVCVVAKALLASHLLLQLQLHLQRLQWSHPLQGSGHAHTHKVQGPSGPIWGVSLASRALSILRLLGSLTALPALTEEERERTCC